MPVEAGGEEAVLARAVHLILEGKPEEALLILSKHYGIPPPRLEVGLPKRCLHALGCYVPSRRTIYVRSSAEYRDPFIILHEYYHHLRWRRGKHRGTEKYADQYAIRAIKIYNNIVTGGRDPTGSNSHAKPGGKP